MKKLYTVSLTEEQRATLKALITRGEAAARALTRARILLKADPNHADGGWSDREISAALETSRPTVERVRQRFVEEGLAAVYPRPRLTTPERRLDGEKEAHLVALACSAPPPGRQRWSLRLLASGLIEREVVDTVSHETVRQTLKKTNSSRG
jgi:transposase